MLRNAYNTCSYPGGTTKGDEDGILATLSSDPRSTILVLTMVDTISCSITVLLGSCSFIPNIYHLASNITNFKDPKSHSIISSKYPWYLFSYTYGCLSRLDETLMT